MVLCSPGTSGSELDMGWGEELLVGAAETLPNVMVYPQMYLTKYGCECCCDPLCPPKGD